MEKSILDRFRMTVTERGLGIYGIKAERMNGESVSHFWRSNDDVNLYSGSKTFTSLAVGMCVKEGRLTTDDHVLDFFPEYRGAAAPGSEDITLRDLLHMASGKKKFWFGELNAQKNEKDWAELFFRVPLTAKPGEEFFYSNACSYMLGRTVEKVSGQNVRDFLLPRLFRPLGILNPQWHTCSGGHPLCATGLYLNLEQFSRLGTFLLHGGQADGKQMVDEGYLQKLSTDLIDNFLPGDGMPETSSGYGYQVWRCSPEGVYRADGMYGQFCIVLPGKGAITITAHEEANPYGLVMAALQEIAPEL